MTEAISTPEPKKSKTKYFVIIVLALAFLVDHYKFHYISGSDEISTTDSTLIITSAPASSSLIKVPVLDTIKKDTSKSIR